ALERGERRRPYPHTVQALATALGLDEDERARFKAAVPFQVSPHRQTRTATGDDDAVADLANRAHARPPSAIGPVMGRDADVATVTALLRGGPRRLVTLTGPGGVGKTTLAMLAAAGVQADFPAGVVVVELADVMRGDGVMPEIGNALGVTEAGFDGTGSALVPHLVERRGLLLVLDNVEHLLSCGPELATLVVACPDLVVLTTSRAPLRVRGEQEVRVSPLPADDAIHLFHDRMAAAGASLDDSDRTARAVAALCEQADGLPLAVELAAVAAARLGPAALLARPDLLSIAAPRDLPHRQRSTAATLDWSLDLLGAPARSLLARLSVCVGGFSLTIAEEIGGGEPSGVLAALSELVEHSLVTRVPDVGGMERFRLLEPVRQHAAARLEATERVAARSGLAGAVLETARVVSYDLLGPVQLSALQLLEADLGNLRVGMEQLVDEARLGDAAELLWLVWYLLDIRGHARECSDWAQLLQGRALGDLGRARWCGGA
ncbi:MAG: AAA family ATPase, partial [Pseudonocardia sp.]|nr:AAA family ATPase [Pseudonocardia sp.]